MFVSEDVQAFLRGLPPEARGLVAALRASVRRTIPQAEESVAWGSLSYHRPELGGRIKGAICLIVVKNSKVRLDFIHGVRLTDSSGLLCGKQVSKRFVPIESTRDISRPEITQLILEAATLSPAELT
jgi:hypothetical protein